MSEECSNAVSLTIEAMQGTPGEASLTGMEDGIEVCSTAPGSSAPGSPPDPLAERPLLQWNIVSLEAKTRRREKKVLLQGVMGSACRGDVVMVMGSSGAGKSCLLDCLSLRTPGFKGGVYMDGQPVDENYYSNTAYVHATDLFFPTLTVREHLTFHGMVRVPSSVPVQQRMQRVAAVLQDVNMTGVMDSLIGAPDSLIRGLSGGERRRLSLATELLSDPHIIFADEPTSGLDAFMALTVAHILVQQAKGRPLPPHERSKEERGRGRQRGGERDRRRLVVAVVHQPSSEIFELATHVLLLSKGRVAFYGPRLESLRFLGSLGHTCPAFYNAADFLIETLSLSHALPAKKGPADEEHGHGHHSATQASQRVAAIVEAYAQSDRARDFDRQLRVLPPHSGAHGRLSLHTVGSRGRTYPASTWTQLTQTFKRTLKSYKREPVLTRVRFVQAISLGLVLGFVYFRRGLPVDVATKNRIGALFLIIMNQVTASNFTVSQAIPKEMPVFMREYLTGANRPSAFFLGLTLAEVPYQVLFPCLFGTLVYWIMGLAPELLRYLTFLLVLVLTANAACSMGYAISTLTGHDALAFALGPVLVLPMCLYVGVMHSPKDIPPYFIPLDAISMIHPAFRAMVINEYESHSYDDTPGLRQLIYDRLCIDPSSLWRDVGTIVSLIFGFRLAAYVFLVIRAKAASV